MKNKFRLIHHLKSFQHLSAHFDAIRENVSQEADYWHGSDSVHCTLAAILEQQIRRTIKAKIPGRVNDYFFVLFFKKSSLFPLVHTCVFTFNIKIPITFSLLFMLPRKHQSGISYENKNYIIIQYVRIYSGKKEKSSWFNCKLSLQVIIY